MKGTTDILAADRCVAWLGPNQPGINEDLHLPRYDDSVCPEGSAAPALCDPGISTNSKGGGQVQTTTTQGGEVPGSQPPAAPPDESGGGGQQEPSVPGLDLPGGAGGQNLDDLLDIPGATGQGGALGQDSGDQNQAANDLLDFLFGN
jgi:hypothetical protein